MGMGKEKDFLVGRKILLVEDEVDLREILAEEIKYYGATAAEAINVRSAQALLAESFYDVIISDMQMPGGSGMELFRSVKHPKNRRTVLMLMTGHADISAEDIYHEGVDAVFTKPFELGNLMDAIDFLLQNPQKRWSRKYERLVGDFSVDIRIENMPDAIHSRVVNIGRGGMCLAIEGSLPVLKQSVHFSLSNKDGLGLQGKAICRWINTNFSPAFVGLEFVGLTDSSINSVLDYLRATEPNSFIPKSAK